MRRKHNQPAWTIRPELLLAMPVSAIEEQLLGVLKGGPLTRDQLVKKLGGIPRTTIYDGLRKLITRNEVKKYPIFMKGMGRGRPQVLFALLDDRTPVEPWEWDWACDEFVIRTLKLGGRVPSKNWYDTLGFDGISSPTAALIIKKLECTQQIKRVGIDNRVYFVVTA